MKKDKKLNKNQLLFGAKCTLLAVSIILLTTIIIFNYVTTNSIPENLYSLFQIIALVLITIVMLFEIVPYNQLSNDAIKKFYQEKDIQVEKFNKFKKVIDNNELVYKFQPIISAKDGSIYAFESLMRTKPEVGLGPRDILKYAQISGKLYDIEYYTFYNTLKIYSENKELFGGSKVFINSIPSVTLKEEDLVEIKNKFGFAAENSVIEILEDCEDTEESLSGFSHLKEIFGCELAIDDYGSGYSNESKLLHNNPNFIKIDITLISSIESDRKKQFLVSNIINFARKYNIKVLAEGVETKEELQTLIELGVDLFQGFYVARPSSDIVAEVNPEVRDYIIAENIRLAKYNQSEHIYEASDNESIRLFDIALEKYTAIKVGNGNFTIVGERDHTIEMVIKTEENSDCTINLENVNMKGSSETTIQVGNGGKLTLNLIGGNTLHKEGILVPAGSALVIVGDGNLTVNADKNDGVRIGSEYTDTFGSITFNFSGTLTINSSGDRFVTVGGGKQADGALINLVNGKLNITGFGIKVVGIGAVTGPVSVLSVATKTRIDINGNEAVGIGTLNGSLKFISNCDINIKLQGEKIVGIGSTNGGEGTITLSKGKVYSEVRGADAVCIGTFNGNSEIICNADKVSAYGEGTNVCGIGNRDGEGRVVISGGTVSSYLLAANPSWFGSGGRNVVITGGCITKGADGITEPVNNFGEPLKKTQITDAQKYNEHVITPKGDYVYRAEKAEDENEMCIFLPLECELKHI